MLTLHVEVATVCPGCRASVALGAVTPEMVCPHCRTPVPLAAEAWKALLVAISEAATTLLELETRDLSDETSTFNASVRLAPPLCGACRAPLPVERIVALASGSPLFCGSCGHGGTRRLIPELADEVSFFGENPLATALCAIVARERSTDKLVTWTRVQEVAVDGAGNSYFVGRVAIEGNADDDLEDAEAAWSLDPNLNLRWLHRFDPYQIETVENVTLIDDRALISGTGACAFVACDDGRKLPTPSHSPFDSGFRALRRDGDASWVVSFGNIAFARMTVKGEPLALYPDKAVGFFANVRDMIHSDPFEGVTGNNPTALLPDGTFAALVLRESPDRVELLRVDRRGEVVTCTVVPIDVHSLRNQHLEVDHEGRVLFLDVWQKRLFVLMPTPSILLQEEIVTPDSHLAILPDDTFWIFGDGGAAHHFGRDGRLLFARDALVANQRDEVEEATDTAGERC
jgi:hypothetical protein